MASESTVNAAQSYRMRGIGQSETDRGKKEDRYTKVAV